MKLKQALEIAQDCGLETVGEALYNISIHATSLFDYKKENDELRELIDDLIANNFQREDKVEDALKIL